MSDEVDAFTYGMVGQSTLEKQKLEARRMAMHNASNSIIGSGLANTAQMPLVGAQIQAGPVISKSSLGPERTYQSQLTMGVQITQADNGFVVMIGHEYGGMGRQFIATTMEDVTNIITSQLASKMLDRVA